MTPNKSKTNFKKNTIIALLAIVALGLVALIIYNKINDKKEVMELDNLSYKESTFFDVINDNDIHSTGTVELQGYAEVVNRNIPDIPDDSYVFFYITNSSSSEFLAFLERMVDIYKEGYFVKENAIGIGCLKDNKISMVRYADRYNGDDESTFTISEDDSKAMLSSSKNNPVKIVIKKDLDTSVVNEIPLCTTLITSVELVK